MQYEVENKFPVTELSRIEKRLSALDAVVSEAMTQIDTYFAHPSRDFASTDEALRIRRVGDRNFLTYKGPKIDTTTKTRREVETGLAPGERVAAEVTAILDALGFRKIAVVSKRRREFEIDRSGVSITGALDEVEHLGTFVELEIVADEEHVEQAKQQLDRLARELELTKPERRSYLELLLQRRE